MNNKFKDFFHDPAKAAEILHNTIPPRQKMTDALLAIVGCDPLWYRDQTARLIVCALLGKIGESMREEHDRTGKVSEDVWRAAFLTTCSELLLNTHERYASQEERESFPINEDATEFDGPVTDEDTDDE